jgi:hypothetical protein
MPISKTSQTPKFGSEKKSLFVKVHFDEEDKLHEKALKPSKKPSSKTGMISIFSTHR